MPCRSVTLRSFLFSLFLMPDSFCLNSRVTFGITPDKKKFFHIMVVWILVLFNFQRRASCEIVEYTHTPYKLSANFHLFQGHKTRLSFFYFLILQKTNSAGIFIPKLGKLQVQSTMRTIYSNLIAHKKLD